MKINRVFCYSKEVAKKNGNKLPILTLIIIGILGMICLFIITGIENEFYAAISTIFIFTWVLLIVYYSVILGLRLMTRVTGYATDTDGRIFKVMIVNNGQGLYLGGVAVGGMIDQLIGGDSSIGKNLGSAVGSAAELYSLNKSAEYISHPEIIAKIIESVPNVTGAEVIEILNVYSIVDRKKSIKIKCDYKYLKYNKIKYNKKLVIEKSFNMIDDLKNVLNTHIQN